MGAVANMTELSNSVHVTDVLSALMSPALVKSTCMLGLMHVEGLPEGTMVKLMQKAGSLTAASLAESTALAIDANGELTDSSVSSTIAKCAVSSGLSVEGETFGKITLARIAQEQGAAIGRFVDNDALGLFSGFGTTVTATTIMTVDDLMLGQYNIFNGNCPDQHVPLQVVLSRKGHYNIKKEIVQSGASIWSQDKFVELLNGKPQTGGSCFMGNFSGMDVYATAGHATSGGDTVQGIFHPMWALFANVAPAPVVWIERKGPEGLYTSVISYLFYDVGEWNDACGVGLLSDT